jgi:hypothetical protein
VKSILSTTTAGRGETILLAPRRGRIPSRFRFVQTDAERHQTLLTAVQRFRGQIYLQDGAIQRDELTADGRHDLPVDGLSWHVLTLDGDGQVRATLRFLDEGEASGFDNLWIRHAAITDCPVWGRRVRQAIEEEMLRARRERLRFGEVGGWAIAPACCNCSAAA